MTYWGVVSAVCVAHLLMAVANRTITWFLNRPPRPPRRSHSGLSARQTERHWEQAMRDDS